MTSLFLKIRGTGKAKKERDSIYSVVSGSDLTPGSLAVWVELPDAIKYDPALAAFKQKYEQHHGSLGSNTPDIDEDNKSVFNSKVTELAPIGDSQLQDEAARNSGDRLIEPTNVNDEIKNSKKKSQLLKALRIAKLSALVCGWILLTVSLLLNREKTEVVLHTAVASGLVKDYHFEAMPGEVSVLVTLTGPFGEQRGHKNNLLYVWLHRPGHNYSYDADQNSTQWAVNLQSEDEIDFAPSVTVSQTLYLTQYRTNTKTNETTAYYALIGDELQNTDNGSFSLRMWSPGNITVPLTVSYHLNPVSERDGIIYAAILLFSLYVLIIFEIINRTLAALLSSSLAVAVLAFCGIRPTLPELVSWLDVETLLLLFSMMLLVAILAETGLFDYLAVIAFERTGGQTWPLITCLCLFTAFFSTFLDNVTTVLLMTPVTIRLCEVLQLNPVPVLISMVIFSNVGGAATPVGDPPNVIIASHPAILSQNINFTTFTLHMGVGILLVGVQTYLQLRYMFRDISSLRHSVPTHLLELRQELAVWRRAAASLSSYSKDEDVVRRALEKMVARLNTALTKREAGGGASRSDPNFCTTLAQMKQKYRIRDKKLLIKSTISVSFVVIVFFLHAIPELQRLSLGWTALLGVLLLLLLSEREDLEPILARVEWSTLLFFAALFVLMEALSKLGLISWIGNMTESLILQVDEKSRLAVAVMLVLWVSGLASAFVDNIPLTTMMVRVIAALADPGGLGLPLAPLAWALSFGACLGGNGTLIGASANVVCAGVAEQHGYRFTFLQYLKIGFPVMIGNLLVSSVYLLFCHCIFEWH